MRTVLEVEVNNTETYLVQYRSSYTTCTYIFLHFILNEVFIYNVIPTNYTELEQKILVVGDMITIMNK